MSIMVDKPHLHTLTLFTNITEQKTKKLSNDKNLQSRSKGEEALFWCMVEVSKCSDTEVMFSVSESEGVHVS